MRRLALLASLLVSCGTGEPHIGPVGVMPERIGIENAKFDTLVEEYLGWWWSMHPCQATTDGIHAHDTRLDLIDPPAIFAGTTAMIAKVDAINSTKLDDDRIYDWLVLRSHLRGQLVELELVRMWERNPNVYNGIISGGLYSLAKLSFAPLASRMELAVARLRCVPGVIVNAKANLKVCPKVYVDVAIDEFGGTHTFIKETLTEAFKPVANGDLRKRFETAQKAALAAVEEFVKWMRVELLPKSVAEFAIGEEAYRRKLETEEMVETPIDDLIKRGEELLKSTQAKFVETAKRIDPNRDPRQILKETAEDHPAADHLLDSVRAMLDDLKKWAAEVCDVPPDASALVQETPAFRRSMSFASMEIPGPFERVATEAYYSVTLPDPSWPKERTEQHLRFYNKYTLPIISVHEAYPGHYVQFLVAKTCRSKVRRVFGCGSFSEGWAHYLEQSFVDYLETHGERTSSGPVAEGRLYSPQLRLHQLHMALLRICRYLARLKMHCRGMTQAEAVALFMEQGYQEKANAEREALRGTSDPTYLVYTLGKHQILALWDEVKETMDRKTFHNRLLRLGSPPLKVARMALLGRRSE